MTLNNRRGVTLLELMIFSSLTVSVLLLASSWFSKPVRIQQKLTAIRDEQKALRASDLWVNDVKQMRPGSLRPMAPLENSLEFQMIGETRQPVSITYRFRDSGLYRVCDGSSSLILGNLSASLFTEDPTLPILILDLRGKASDGSTLRVVRRVALPA